VKNNRRYHIHTHTTDSCIKRENHEGEFPQYRFKCHCGNAKINRHIIHEKIFVDGKDASLAIVIGDTLKFGKHLAADGTGDFDVTPTDETIKTKGMAASDGTRWIDVGQHTNCAHTIVENLGWESI
jgi:hypothetical protein